MPQNFQRIGSYILDHEQSVAFASIHAVSKAVGVSSASLVRFAKSLGFDGYQEFKKEIQNEMRHRLNPYDKIALSELGTLSEEKRLQKLLQNEYHNLRSTFTHIEVQDLKDIAEGIRVARKVYVSGFGATSHIVKIFEYTLMSSLDRDVAIISGSVSDYAPILKSFRAEDVMVLMTFPPYSAEVRHVARVAKERGGRLYLFTDSASCPVYPMADRVIRCITNSLLLSNSFVGLVSVLHVLTQMLYLEEQNLAVESRQKTIIMQEIGYSLMESESGNSRNIGSSESSTY